MKQKNEAAVAAKAKMQAEQQAGKKVKPEVRVKEKTEPGVEEKMPLGKINYIMMGVCILLIAVGFFLMSGSSNEGSNFNSDVFSSTRIVVAPFITFLGFILMVPAILWHGKKTQETDQ